MGEFIQEHNTAVTTTTPLRFLCKPFLETAELPIRFVQAATRLAHVPITPLHVHEIHAEKNYLLLLLQWYTLFWRYGSSTDVHVVVRVFRVFWTKILGATRQRTNTLELERLCRINDKLTHHAVQFGWTAFLECHSAILVKGSIPVQRNSCSSSSSFTAIDVSPRGRKRKRTPIYTDTLHTTHRLTQPTVPLWHRIFPEPVLMTADTYRRALNDDQWDASTVSSLDDDMAERLALLGDEGEDDMFKWQQQYAEASAIFERELEYQHQLFQTNVVFMGRLLRRLWR